MYPPFVALVGIVIERVLLLQCNQLQPMATNCNSLPEILYNIRKPLAIGPSVWFLGVRKPFGNLHICSQKGRVWPDFQFSVRSIEANRSKQKQTKTNKSSILGGDTLYLPI